MSITRLSLSVAALLVAIGTGVPAAQAFSLSVGGSADASATASGTSTSAGGSLGANVGLDVGQSSGTTSGSAGTTAGTTASTGSDGSVSAGASAAASASTSLAALTPSGKVAAAISLIENNNWTKSTLAGTASLSGDAMVDLTPLLSASTQASLDAALNANASGVGNLQAALAQNAAISAWLASNDVSAENVVAVGANADGSLTFFTQQ